MTQVMTKERDGEESQPDRARADADVSSTPLGLVALLWRRTKRREWCCEACREAAEQMNTW
jgi:hypothetical protein